MSLYQRFVRDVLYPADLWRSGDARQLRYLEEFEHSQYLSGEQVQELQLRRLRTLLEHANQHCPFYQRRFQESGFAPSDIETLGDLSRLPVLEKSEIQTSRDAMVAVNWARGDLIPNRTGGSTGAPLSFFLSRDRKWSRAAATIRHNRWAGWDVGDKVALLWGAPRDAAPNRFRAKLRNWLIDQQLFLDTANVTEQRMLDFHHSLKKFRPRVLLAYAQAITLFAKFLKSRSLTPYQPESIVTSAEVLEPDDRATVEETFGCKIFNRYGSREVSVLASECDRHDGLHVMSEGLYLEIVRPEGNDQSSGAGSILVTDLMNLAMPLIRYRIGDMGEWAKGECGCGRGLPRLSSVSGRVTDFLVGEDRRLVSGVFLATYVAAQRPSLGQVQIHQDQPGQVLYRIRPNGRFDADAEFSYLTQETRRYLGSNAKVEFEITDELPHESSGKYVFCRSAAASNAWS
ncbi:MAG: hypothetical protein N2C14_25580 [Planctomycetales bacterium]